MSDAHNSSSESEDLLAELGLPADYAQSLARKTAELKAKGAHKSGPQVGSKRKRPVEEEPKPDEEFLDYGGDSNDGSAFPPAAAVPYRDSAKLTIGADVESPEGKPPWNDNSIDEEPFKDGQGRLGAAEESGALDADDNGDGDNGVGDDGDGDGKYGDGTEGDGKEDKEEEEEEEEEQELRSENPLGASLARKERLAGRARLPVAGKGMILRHLALGPLPSAASSSSSATDSQEEEEVQAATDAPAAKRRRLASAMMEDGPDEEERVDNSAATGMAMDADGTGAGGPEVAFSNASRSFSSLDEILTAVRIVKGAVSSAFDSSSSSFAASSLSPLDEAFLRAAVSNKDAVVAMISSSLQEPNTAALGLAIDVLPDHQIDALLLLDQTLAVERSGGMTTADGSRRRTPGGVFFALLRDCISKEDYKLVLEPQTKAHTAARNQKKKLQDQWRDATLPGFHRNAGAGAGAIRGRGRGGRHY